MWKKLSLSFLYELGTAETATETPEDGSLSAARNPDPGCVKEKGSKLKRGLLFEKSRARDFRLERGHHFRGKFSILS